MTTSKFTFFRWIVTAALCGFPTIINAQIYVNSLVLSKVGEYNFDGSTINDSFITGVGQPFGITSGGGHIYVSTAFGGVGEYNFDGSVVNASLISGLNAAQGIAANSTDLFAVEYGSQSVGKYQLDGTPINSSLITSLLYPIGIAVSATNIFVTNTGTGTIMKYDLDGTQVSSWSAYAPDGRSIAIVDDLLYVTSYAFGRIGVYNANTGATINDSLISGLIAPYGIAAAGEHLYITNGYLNGRVSEYNLDGSLVNESLVSGLSAPSAIMVIEAVPEPATYGWMSVGGVLCLIAFKSKARRPRHSYIHN